MATFNVEDIEHEAGGAVATGQGETAGAGTYVKDLVITPTEEAEPGTYDVGPMPADEKITAAEKAALAAKSGSGAGMLVLLGGVALVAYLLLRK